MDQASLQKSFALMTSLLQEQVALQEKQVELQQQQFQFFQAQNPRNASVAAHKGGTKSAAAFLPSSALPSSTDVDEDVSSTKHPAASTSSTISHGPAASISSTKQKAWQLSDVDDEVTEVLLDEPTKHPVPPEPEGSPQEFSQVTPIMASGTIMVTPAASKDMRHDDAELTQRLDSDDSVAQRGAPDAIRFADPSRGQRLKAAFMEKKAAVLHDGSSLTLELEQGNRRSMSRPEVFTPKPKPKDKVLTPMSKVFGRAKKEDTKGTEARNRLNIINDMDREARNVSEYGKKTMRRLITFRVFEFGRSTILTDGDVLLKECLIPLLFYIATGVIVALASQGGKGTPEVMKYTYNDVVAVPTLLVIPLSYFVGFFLYQSFYRWWWLRESGIGGIWQNVMKLIFYLQVSMKDNESAVAACRRYGRASLMLVFMCRRVDTGYDRELEFWKLPLNVAEKKLLAKIKGGYAEIMWVWLAQVLRHCYEQGDMTEYEYTILMGIVDSSLSLITQMYARLNTPLPFRWAHLLCFFTKLHNITLSVSGGFVLGAWILSHQYDEEYEVLHFLKMSLHVILTPFVFNAILILCMEMQFPVDGSGTSDFPMLTYDSCIETDCLALMRGQALVPPEWQRKQEAGQKQQKAWDAQESAAANHDVDIVQCA